MRGPESPTAAAFRELGAQETQLLESGFIDAVRLTGLSGREIYSVDRSPLESTWYRTEIVTVTLDSGEQMKCFLKDFGSYEREKGQMVARRERERFFYKELFPNGELGLPAFVADIWSDKRTWLIIEFVEGVPLGWCELDAWYDAAAWLGRWQTTTAGKLPDLRASGHFAERDPGYFADIARRAEKGASQFGNEVSHLVEASLPAYLEGSKILMEQPQTLVHGAYRRDQILVDTKETPPRICPIDWEISAIGSCLYDLAALADGFEGAQLGRFLERYISEATWLPNHPDAADLRATIKIRNVHRTLKWIAGAEARGFPSSMVHELAVSLTEPAKELQT